MAKQIEDKWDTSNSDRHATYEDHEIDLILSFSPSKNNCEVLGRNLKRSSSAIAMIFRVANTPKGCLDTNYRKDDLFIKQIKRLARKNRWITGQDITQYRTRRVAK